MESGHHGGMGLYTSLQDLQLRAHIPQYEFVDFISMMGYLTYKLWCRIKDDHELEYKPFRKI